MSPAGLADIIEMGMASGCCGAGDLGALRWLNCQFFLNPPAGLLLKKFRPHKERRYAECAALHGIGGVVDQLLFERSGDWMFTLLRRQMANLP
jgi:hypothetical protein